MKSIGQLELWEPRHEHDLDRLLLGWAGWMRGRGLCENTIEQRVAFVAMRQHQFGGVAASSEDVARWLGSYTGWTRRTYHHHLKSWFAWLVKAGLRDRSPLDDLRIAHAPSPRPRPLSPAQAAAVLGGASGNLYAWLLLAKLAGLRAHEIAKVHGRDISAESLHVVGKGGQAALLPTHPELWRLAQGYPRNGFWFPSPFPDRAHLSGGRISQAVGRHFADLGIDGSVHRLRATYGTELLRAGVNIKVIQHLMRHRSLISTEHYLGVAEEDLVAAIHGLAA